MAIDADLHADEEAFLMNQGSEQKNLWGISLYPEFKNEDDFIEFDAMINIRPSQENKTRGVDNLNTQKRIRKIVNKLVSK